MLLFLLVLSVQLSAQKIPFQGRLLDNGRPYNGISTIEFNIASPSWSETKSNVNVTDGYYSVVLGETTPLPDTLFSNSPEVQLNIIVNGEALSPVTLYSTLLPYAGPQGIEVDTLRTFMAEAIGVNDEGKARIATTNNGYDGVMSLTDSLGRTANFMRTRKTGGFLQLAQQDFTDDSFKSAALMATFGDQNSYMNLYGANSTDDGISLMVDVYAANIDLDGPIEDGYRRGGIDIKNYYGNFTHNIFSEHEGSSTISNMNLVASQDDGTQTYSMIISSGDGLNTGGSINITDETGAGSISLDGTTGTINARQVLIDGSPIGGSSGGTINPDSVESRSIRVLGPDGSIKSDLNFFEQNNSGSLVLNGANDSTKVILGSTGGYGGFLGLYDSLRNIGAQLRVTNKGVGNLFTRNEAHNNVGWFGGNGNDGFAQVVSFDETEAFTGAALIGSFADGLLPEYYLEGSAQQNFGLGRFRVTPLGNSTEETARIEINRSNGGGQAIMTMIQNNDGNDPTGSNGALSLVGDSSPNFVLDSESSVDHDLAQLNMYGSIPTEDGLWWYNSGRLGTAVTSTGDEFGFLGFNSNTTNYSAFTVNLTGNLNESFAGGLELNDGSGGNRIRLDAATGNISINRFSNNQSAINIFDNGSGGGGIAIQNASDQNKLFYEASAGTLDLKEDTGSTTISLNGNNGDISAQGQIFGNTIASSDGTIQTSDRRLKKNILDLDNTLSKTLQLRGVSYQWKDEYKSQRNQIGVIAQEVEAIYPEFVHTDENGMKAVNYAQMTAVLIEAIKELNAKVETLENENSSLKSSLAEVETLRKDMDKLMKMLGSGKAAGK